jgi:hypothetical protein
MDIKKDYNAKSKANGQTKNIDQGLNPIPEKYPECNPEETGEHANYG